MAVLINKPSLHFENLNTHLVSYRILINFVSAVDGLIFYKL